MNEQMCDASVTHVSSYLEWMSVAQEALSNLQYKTGRDRKSCETETFFHVLRILWDSPPLCLGRYKSLIPCPNIIPVVTWSLLGSQEGYVVCCPTACVYNPPPLSYNGIPSSCTYTLCHSICTALLSVFTLIKKISSHSEDSSQD